MSRRAREKTDDRGRQQRRRKTSASASASASSSSSSSSSGSAAAESPVDLSEDEGGLFVQMYRFPGAPCSSYASRPIFTTIAPRRRAVFVFAVPARGVRARP